MTWTVRALLVALLVVRLPSLAEPAGGDQGLYAYVGQAILRGELPYRDAWDQKPPAIHYTYAALYGLWSDEAVVAAADLTAAAIIAVLLLILGRRLAGRPGAGEAAALLYLLFANPAFTRLGGVRIRSQCETFIALAVTLALVCLRVGVERARTRSSGVDPAGRHVRRDSNRTIFLAGLLLALAVLYKYNAVVYLLAAACAWAFWTAEETDGTIAITSWRPALAQLRTRAAGALPAFGLGCAVPVTLMLGGFGVAGALDELYEATVLYNLRYSGETYPGAAAFLGYLLTFPVWQARVDPLWLLGGAGSAVLLASGLRRSSDLVPAVWVAAACLAIAVNGSRSLPQYFVQAAPALALAAGLAGDVLWRATGPRLRTGLALVVLAALSRVVTFDKVVDYAGHDLRYLTGRISRAEHLARFGGLRPADKFAALSEEEIAAFIARETTADDSVLIFGFSGGAYVKASRRSASRFFWSYPIISGFNAGHPSYGAAGLHADLERNRPRFVILQDDDWGSATYFLGEPRLAGWLRANYGSRGELRNYAVWVRQ
jgi:hypothetical protein